MGTSIRGSDGSGELFLYRLARETNAQIGALISRKVPPTKTEKVSYLKTSPLTEQAMRRRLAEMREESEE